MTIRKVTKISNVHIPKHHRKWAGEEEEPKEEKKLDPDKIAKLIERTKDKKKYVTYNSKGEIIVYDPDD